MKKVPCEIYSRVVGYFRPVGQWNEGKKSEFDDRYHYMQTDVDMFINKNLEGYNANNEGGHKKP